jgi:hypothetical protein
VGTAATALVASGIPCAYYPHLPPELTRPLPQLFAVLIGHGFAPPNLGNLFGVWSTASILPLAAAALAALLVCILAASDKSSASPEISARPARATALVSVVALLSASVWLVPIWLRPSHEPGVAKAVGFVTRRFQPADHDRAATLHTQLTAAGTNADPALWTALQALYNAEGREHEAELAAKHRVK